MGAIDRRAALRLLTLAACTSVTTRAAAEPSFAVVATLPDLWTITRALVGELGTVHVATRPGQNPHDMEIRPSQIVLVKRAQILVRNGLDEDAWIDPVIESSGNPRLLRGAPSVIEAVRGLGVLKVRSGSIARSATCTRRGIRT